MHYFKLKLFIVALFCLMVTLPSGLFAQDYGLGGEGLKGGSLPERPGFYYLMYNSFYTADKMMDNSGDEVNGADLEISVAAMANRFLYMTDKTVFGGNYAFHLIVPILNMNLDIGNMVDDTESGIADIIVEPLLLAWHKKRFDASFAVALYLPTGEYDKDAAVNIGKDHFTVQLTQGLTYFFDTEKKWHASYLARYEKHLENRDLDITFGDDIDLDWGIGKSIATYYDVGVVGYSCWQITEDKGSDATNKSQKDQVHAVGLEFSGFYPHKSYGFKARYQKEVAAKNRTKGQQFIFDLVFAF